MPPAGAGDFRAIQAHVERGAATWQTARVSTPSALTVHDVDAALERIRHETDAAPSRGMSLPSGARPGFLTAVAELIDLAVTGVNRKADTRELLRPRVQYVFGQGAYEIHLREVEPLRADYDGRVISGVRTAFEIRTLATDARTRFEITSGSDGDLAGVPVAISWQPRCGRAQPQTGEAHRQRRECDGSHQFGARQAREAGKQSSGREETKITERRGALRRDRAARSSDEGVPSWWGRGPLCPVRPPRHFPGDAGAAALRPRRSRTTSSSPFVPRWLRCSVVNSVVFRDSARVRL